MHTICSEFVQKQIPLDVVKIMTLQAIINSIGTHIIHIVIKLYKKYKLKLL